MIDVTLEQIRENFESFWKHYCGNYSLQDCKNCLHRETIANIATILDVVESEDLISRADLIEAHYDACNNDPNKAFYTWSLQLMKDAPSAINMK